jgi:hypothetical protein
MPASSIAINPQGEISEASSAGHERPFPAIVAAVFEYPQQCQ